MSDTKPQTESRIPEFKSIEEEAEWFDTHDMGDYQDEFKPVKVRFAKNLSEGVTIRLDPRTLAKLLSHGEKEGIGPVALARMWIIEQVGEEEEHQAAKVA